MSEDEPKNFENEENLNGISNIQTNKPTAPTINTYENDTTKIETNDITNDNINIISEEVNCNEKLNFKGISIINDDIRSKSIELNILLLNLKYYIENTLLSSSNVQNSSNNISQFLIQLKNNIYNKAKEISSKELEIKIKINNNIINLIFNSLEEISFVFSFIQNKINTNTNPINENNINNEKEKNIDDKFQYYLIRMKNAIRKSHSLDKIDEEAIKNKNIEEKITNDVNKNEQVEDIKNEKEKINTGKLVIKNGEIIKEQIKERKDESQTIEVIDKKNKIEQIEDKKEEIKNNKNENMEIEEEKNKNEQMKERKDESQNKNTENQTRKNKKEKIEERKEENENNENKKTEKKYTGRKRGRYSRKQKANQENSNMYRKIFNKFKKYLCEFVNEYIEKYTPEFQFFEPTIKEDINSWNDIIRFLHITSLELFNKHTAPKNMKGANNLVDMNKEEKVKFKKALVKERNKPIMERMKKEENMEKKPVTAIMETTLLDFLRVFLNYGYDPNINMTIEIDETKYGFDKLVLEGFETYKTITQRGELKIDVEKSDGPRPYLKKKIYGE